MDLTQPDRRHVLKTLVALSSSAAGLIAAACQNAASSSTAASTPSPRPYESAIATDSPARAAFQCPHLVSIPTCMAQANNWLDAMQGAYGFSPATMRLVMISYLDSNVITYNDTLWERYQLGKRFSVVDPTTKQPAVRNIYHNDVQKLQARRAVFYT